MVKTVGGGGGYQDIKRMETSGTFFFFFFRKWCTSRSSFLKSIRVLLVREIDIWLTTHLVFLHALLMFAPNVFRSSTCNIITQLFFKPTQSIKKNITICWKLIRNLSSQHSKEKQYDKRGRTSSWSKRLSHNNYSPNSYIVLSSWKI